METLLGLAGRNPTRIWTNK